MRWVFDNLQVVLAIAGAIAYWLNARRQKEGGEDEAERTMAEREARRRQIAEQIRGAAGDGGDEAAERTRRVQEDIRRRIAERQGRPLPTPPPVMRSERPMAPRELAPRPVAGPFETFRREEPKPFDEHAASHARGAELQRQEDLAEQLRVLEAARAKQERRAKEVAVVAQEDARATAAMPGRTDLFGALRDPQSLRRAIVLREVLGAPVALR